jgi:hypothetical protein
MVVSATQEEIVALLTEPDAIARQRAAGLSVGAPKGPTGST